MSRLDGIAALLQRTDANLARVRGPAAPRPSSHDIALEWHAFQKQWQKEKQDELGELRAFLVLSDQKMTSLQNKYDETEKSLRSQLAIACVDVKRQAQPQDNVELRLLQKKVQMLDSEIKESRQPDFSIEEVKRGIAEVSSRMEFLSGKFDMLQREKDLGAGDGLEWRLAQLEAHQKIQKETALQDDSALICLRRRLDHLELEVAQAQRSSERVSERHDAIENRLRSDDVGTELLKQKYGTMADQTRTMTQSTHNRLTEVEKTQDDVWRQFNALKDHTMDMMTKLHEKTDFSPRKLGESLTEALQSRIAKVEDQLPKLHTQELFTETFEDYSRKVDALQLRFDAIEEVTIMNPHQDQDTANLITWEETSEHELPRSGNFARLGTLQSQVAALDQMQATEVYGRLTALDREVEQLKSNPHLVRLGEMEQQGEQLLVPLNVRSRTAVTEDEAVMNQATVNALFIRLEHVETQLRTAEAAVTAPVDVIDGGVAMKPDSDSVSVALQVAQVEAQITKMYEEVERAGETARKNMECLDDKVYELSRDVGKLNPDKWADLEHRLGAMEEKTIRTDNTPHVDGQTFDNEGIAPSRIAFLPDAKKIANLELTIDQLVKDHEKDVNTLSDKLDRAVLDVDTERETIAQRLHALEFGEITESSVTTKSAAHLIHGPPTTSERLPVAGASIDSSEAVAIAPVDTVQCAIRDHASRIADLEAVYASNIPLTVAPETTEGEYHPRVATATVQGHIDNIEQRLDHLVDFELRSLADHVGDLKEKCAQVESLDAIVCTMEERIATELAERDQRWEARVCIVENSVGVKESTGDHDQLSNTIEEGDMAHIKQKVETLEGMIEKIHSDKTGDISRHEMSAIVGTLEEQTSATILQDNRISALEAFMKASCEVSPGLTALDERVKAVEFACEQEHDGNACGAADIETRFAILEDAIPEMRKIIADLSTAVGNSREMQAVHDKIESYCERVGKIERELPELSRLRHRLDVLGASTPAEERLMRIQEKLGLLAQENQTFRRRMQNFHTQLERAIEQNPLVTEVEDRPTHQRVRFLEEQKEQLREDLFHVERRILQVEQSLLDVVALPPRPSQTNPTVVPELEEIRAGHSDTDSGFFERSEGDLKSGGLYSRQDVAFFEDEGAVGKKNASAQDKDDDDDSLSSLFSPQSQKTVQESSKAIREVTEQSAPPPPREQQQQQLTDNTMLPARNIDVKLCTSSIALESPRSGSSHTSSSRVYAAAPVPRPIRREDLVERHEPDASSSLVSRVAPHHEPCGMYEHPIIRAVGEARSLASYPMSQRQAGAMVGRPTFGERAYQEIARDASSRTSSKNSSRKGDDLVAVSSSFSKHSRSENTGESLSRAPFHSSSGKQTEQMAPPSSFQSRRTDALTVCTDSRSGLPAATGSLPSFAAHLDEAASSSHALPQIALSVSSSPMSLNAPKLLDTRAPPAAYFVPHKHHVRDTISSHIVQRPISPSHDQSWDDDDNDDDDPDKTRLITREDVDATILTEIHQPTIPERKNSIGTHTPSVLSNQSSAHSDRIGAPASYPPRMSPTNSVASSAAPCLSAGSASSENSQNKSVAKSSRIDGSYSNVKVCVDASGTDDEICGGDSHVGPGSVHSQAEYPTLVTDPLLSPIRFLPESSDDEDIEDLFARAM
eukprot:GEMP01000891.1.p1 GENE.GEMP01000891.1~~GEMP01000891.1.p1  ORF type:complete len:1655 (+),score=403.54 GEMP01000891.1:274-5238(+)